MFAKILVANRGEIACRVIATARKMGIRTVAVYSDADADARHVSAADEAIRLGPAPARDSYLRGDLIVDAARATGAQAVHPGYGFLSENESFAQALADHNIVFIGPPPFAIHAMGSKSEAKQLMARAGVPLVPGYHGERQEPGFLHEQADAIGYPVLIKASAGGGGKGMRVVSATADFEAALASCQREARSAFGDDRVLVEKYVQRPRHIEMQVFADTHGNAVHLFERDCSVQRRHQKIIEEAPAPGMTIERRNAMGAAAVAAARAVGYVGAGTVEFIVDNAGEFFFMEMNTRLQVEHPVTEMITGHDLVEWQLRVAAGEPLPIAGPDLQSSLAISGHAIEARIYAENPDGGFLPSTGQLVHFAQPDAVEFSGQASHPRGAVRMDAGVRAGDAITPHYDPMIAKLIVWGEDRAHALARMRAALADVHIVGVANNVDFLSRLIVNPAFARAELDTGLIERERDRLFVHGAAHDRVSHELLALACARVLADEARAATNDPWASAHGWRLNMAYHRTLTLKSERGVHDVEIEYGRDATTLRHDGFEAPLAISTAGRSALAIRFAGRTLTADVVRAGDELHLFCDGRHRVLALVDVIAQSAAGDAGTGKLTAPMPGKVIALPAVRGQRVERGAPLVVMEAMKMEHTIVAPAAGLVAEVLFDVGDQVAEGAELVRLEIGP